MIGAMREYPDDLPLQTCATWMILNFCYLHKENQDKVTEMDGVKLVVDAMKRFNTDDDMQDKGCGMLRNMADLSAANDIVAKHGGINQVLQAMDTFSDSPSIVANAIGALRNLAYSVSTRQEIFHLGGLHQIMSAMERHLQADLVQEFALEAVWNLATHDDVRQRFAESSIVKTVLTSMRFHRWDTRIVAEGLHALSLLAQNEVMERQVAADDGLRFVSELLNRFSSTRSVQEQVVRHSNGSQDSGSLTRRITGYASPAGVQPA